MVCSIAFRTARLWSTIQAGTAMVVHLLLAFDWLSLSLPAVDLRRFVPRMGAGADLLGRLNRCAVDLGTDDRLWLHSIFGSHFSYVGIRTVGTVCRIFSDYASNSLFGAPNRDVVRLLCNLKMLEKFQFCNDCG